jgi:hypothetical protein
MSVTFSPSPKSFLTSGKVNRAVSARYFTVVTAMGHRDPPFDEGLQAKGRCSYVARNQTQLATQPAAISVSDARALT